jgi:hypothetical protein
VREALLLVYLLKDRPVLKDGCITPEIESNFFVALG